MVCHMLASTAFVDTTPHLNAKSSSRILLFPSLYPSIPFPFRSPSSPPPPQQPPSHPHLPPHHPSIQPTHQPQKKNAIPHIPPLPHPLPPLPPHPPFQLETSWDKPPQRTRKPSSSRAFQRIRIPQQYSTGYIYTASIPFKLSGQLEERERERC